MLVRRVLHHHQLGDDEILFQDGLDVSALDKLIESLAPASPRRVEDDENVFMRRHGLRACLGEHFIGARQRVRKGPGGNRKRNCHGEGNSIAHHGGNMERASESGQEQCAMQWTPL
jgi:hypothetical protein